MRQGGTVSFTGKQWQSAHQNPELPDRGQIMEEILTRARKVAEEAEVYVASTVETPGQFESNRLKHIQTKQSKMVALRIIRKGRIGYATTTRLGDYGELVENAVATAEFGQKAEFHFPSTAQFKKINIYDPAVEHVTLQQMTSLGKEMIDEITGFQDGILCEAGVTKIVCDYTIFNSRGGHASYRQTVFGAGIEGQLVRGTDMLFFLH